MASAGRFADRPFMAGTDASPDHQRAATCKSALALALDLAQPRPLAARGPNPLRLGRTTPPQA